MLVGKCARIGAVILAGVGATVVSAVAASTPVGAVPSELLWGYASPSAIPVSGVSQVVVRFYPYVNGASTVGVSLSGGLVIASPSNASVSGSDNPGISVCTGTITATPGSNSVSGTATSNQTVIAQGLTECDYTFDVTSNTPGTGIVTASSSLGGYGNTPFDITTSGPPVTGLSPVTGPGAGGTKVTVIGSGFTGATAVDFGGTPATHVKVAKGGHSLTAVAPPGSGTEDVTVTTPADGPGVPQSATDTFTYLAPTITSISPTSGPITGGKKVSVKGADLQGATVTIGGTPAAGVKVNKAGTSLKAEVPVGQVGPAAVVVATAAGSATTTYTYTS
jgi:hypothetical protein